MPEQAIAGGAGPGRRCICGWPAGRHLGAVRGRRRSGEHADPDRRLLSRCNLSACGIAVGACAVAAHCSMVLAAVAQVDAIGCWLLDRTNMPSSGCWTLLRQQGRLSWEGCVGTKGCCALGLDFGVVGSCAGDTWVRRWFVTSGISDGTFGLCWNCLLQVAPSVTVYMTAAAGC